MKHIPYYIISLFVVVAASFFLMSCGKDFQDDIDRLNVKHDSIERRLASVENQVNSLNSQLLVLSKLSTAVEHGFYVTKVLTTADGYELTLSNGCVITLQNGSGSTLTQAPAVSMTQIAGMYYWTQNGMLITDTNGQPIRTSEKTPVVKYDNQTQQWLISFDGGVTFVSVNQQASIVINDTVLLQLINTYMSRYHTTLVSAEMLYQIITTYIQQNYMQLFNVDVLNQVVVSYLQQNCTKMFGYEQMEQIFSQYNYEYATSHIQVEEITNVLVAFIAEHQDIFVNNEVLYEIISNYVQLNNTTVFTNEMLVEVVGNFIRDNQNIINVELLQRVVFSYIDQHQEIIVNNEVLQTLLMQYMQLYYQQIFSQQILVQCINSYITSNASTIFNQELISGILDNYVQNNRNTIISSEAVHEIITAYLTQNSTTVINRDLLLEVITNYFQKHYDLFIDRTVIQTVINTYISQHQSTLISVDIIQQVVLSYVQQYYAELFSHDFLTQIITIYFDQNLKVINQFVDFDTDIISNVKVDDDLFSIELKNGKTISLVVYDAFSRLRDRVQSIVFMPDSGGHFTEKQNPTGIGGSLDLTCFVTPTSMTKVIYYKILQGEIELEMIATDGNGNLSTIPVSMPQVKYEGVLGFKAETETYGAVKAVALHLKETKIAGTDIMTEFCVVDTEKPATPAYYTTCPDDKHPHMIDLGLPSGTLWACCNVGAKIPEDFGGYYAWGEIHTKTYYDWKYYSLCTNSDYQTCQDLGDIAGTIYDVAHVLWKENWRMPNASQVEELLAYCKYDRVTRNNVTGTTFDAVNGGSIFLPDAGGKLSATDWWSSASAAYWSSTPYYKYVYYAQGFGVIKEKPTTANVLRSQGMSVRPVCQIAGSRRSDTLNGTQATDNSRHRH